MTKPGESDCRWFSFCQSLQSTWIERYSRLRLKRASSICLLILFSLSEKKLLKLWFN